MSYGEMSRGRNNISTKVEKKTNRKSICRNYLNDIGTKCRKVEMTVGEMFKGRITIGSKSAKVEMTKNLKVC